VATFDADPGRLSAAFVWARMRRVFGGLPPAARYVIGGWSTMLARMEAYARALGVSIELGSRVDRLPEPPVIVATSLAAARPLLGDDSLGWESGRTLLLDLGLRRRRGDAFVISDLDEAGWAERYTAPDPSRAPPGHSLVQAQLPLRPGETSAAGLQRLERLLDLGYAGWPGRQTWRRQGIANGRTGALDLPGPDLAGPARGRPRRRRVPGRRHGGRSRPAQRGPLRQRPPRQPPRPPPAQPDSQLTAPKAGSPEDARALPWRLTRGCCIAPG
jgi:hypothetical protein